MIGTAAFAVYLSTIESEKFCGYVEFEVRELCSEGLTCRLRPVEVGCASRLQGIRIWFPNHSCVQKARVMDKERVLSGRIISGGNVDYSRSDLVSKLNLSSHYLDEASHQ